MKHSAVFLLSLLCFVLVSGCLVYAQASESDWYEKTLALKYAAKEGRVNDVCKLLDEGARIDEEIGGWNALVAATSEGHLDVVKLLIDRGADVNMETFYGGRALLRAAEKGDLAMSYLLVKKGADVNAQSQAGVTALMIASSNGAKDLVKMLLNRGADVNARTKKGTTALDSVYMLGVTADRVYGAGQVPLWPARKRITVDHREVARLLLEHNAKCSDPDIAAWLRELNKDVETAAETRNRLRMEKVKKMLEESGRTGTRK